MSIAGRDLGRPGKFEEHRTQSGAATADSATINDTNNPPTDAFFGKGCDTVWVYWTGDGGAAADTVVIQPLLRDGVNNFWVRLPTISFVKDVAQEVAIRGANQVYLRFNTVSGTTCTNLKIRVAKAADTSPM